MGFDRHVLILLAASQRVEEGLQRMDHPSLDQARLFRLFRMHFRGDRLTKWDGSLELSGGRILAAVPFAMENPEKGITSQTHSRVGWISNTTGDDDGVDVTVEAPAGAALRFHTPVIQLEVKLSDLADGRTLTFPAGGVDLRVFLRRLPARGQTSDLAFDHTDPSPTRGRCHPYWIRVTQEDGAQAWTSPVYLDL